MAAKEGNKYWQFRNKHGRDKKYNPEELWNEFVQYMEWLEENPLIETKPFAFQGKITLAEIPKMRAATLSGFCLFADITLPTYKDYRSQHDFSSVVTRIDNAISAQKFEGAAAELLNPNIIARDLGLRDGHDHTTKGESIKQVTISMPEEEPDDDE